MKCYWKDGFYLEGVNCDAQPKDAVEITEKEYQTLLEGQTAGKRIVTGTEGAPELADRLSVAPDPVTAAKRMILSLQRRAAIRSIGSDDDATASVVAPACPEWAAGEHYENGDIVNRDGQPYRVVQAVDSLEHQPPGADGMLAIYRPIDPAPGTHEEPKKFYLGMDVTSGLYYTHMGKLYLAKADLLACIYAPGTEGVWQWERVTDME